MAQAARETCSICGRELPNRWAVAGRCGADGCSAPFCALHWHIGNGLCREHGWERKSKPQSAAGPAAAAPAGEEPAREPPSRRAGVFARVAALFAASAKRLKAAFDKIRGVRNPAEQLLAIDAKIAENRHRRIPLAQRYDALYEEIAAKRKIYLAESSAKKKILELELRTLLAEFKGLERELAIYFENERSLAFVRSKMLELAAMDRMKLKEADVDTLAGKIEDAVADADDTARAIADLEKTGRRVDFQSDADFEAALASFGDEARTDASYSDEAPASLSNKQSDSRVEGMETVWAD